MAKIQRGTVGVMVVRAFRGIEPSRSFAVALALVGCADGRFDERGGDGRTESTGKVAERLDSKSLKQRLLRLEGEPPPACDYETLCDGQGCSMGTLGGKNVMYVTGDVTFSSNRCTFLGQIRIHAPDVELDCNGSVIDGRQLNSHGIRNGELAEGSAEYEALSQFHDGCAPATLPVKNVTVSNCIVKYSGQEGVALGRSFGQQKVNNTCVEIEDEVEHFFGPVVDGYHQPGNYQLPEYLVNELSADTRRRLRGKLSDAGVMNVLRELSPQNIVLDHVTLAFNQRLQLYVRPYTTGLTIRSSLLVQSPHGMPLHCSDPFCTSSTFDCADTRAGWDCGLLDDGSQEKDLCEAVKNACSAYLIKYDDNGEEVRIRRHTVYVDRESKSGSFDGVEFRRDMSDEPEASRDTDGQRYPTHIALDSTRLNSIVDSRFFGAANGIMSFKNCGERDRYRLQNSADNTISGNVFALADEATAVWLGSRQGGRYNPSETSPFNCFLEGEAYPWLILPPFESRGTILDAATYESLVDADGSNYCRQELPEMVGSCDASGCDAEPMFFDFSINNEVTGNWFRRRENAMPSIISWERKDQVDNVISGNFANRTHDTGTDPTMRTVCKRNGFLASPQVDQERTGSGGVTQANMPIDLLNSVVPELLEELRELGGTP